MTSSLVYFDCFSGASGDMLLGSLVDAGLPLEELRAGLDRLGVSGYQLAAERVTRRGLTGTHLRVQVEPDERPARHPADVEALIGGSDLPATVRARALAVFRRLARVEAAIHGIRPEEVHFHEIGAVDSLVDVVGFALGLEWLGVEAVYCSPLPLGGGTIETEHGRLPVPAPATLALLAEAGAQVLPGPGHGELVTPTGAALLAETAVFAQPAMTLRRVGYGFGTKDFPWANALRAWLGEPLSVEPTPGDDQVVEIACNLDTASGEVLGYVLERLLAAGALDAWSVPLHMKKSRPGTMLCLLARPDDASRLAELVLRETPTLGVRWRRLSRTTAGREMRQVTTPWGPVRVKVKLLAGEAVSASPEYDDCARLAAATGVPLQRIMDAARLVAEGELS